MFCSELPSCDYAWTAISHTWWTVSPRVPRMKVSELLTFNFTIGHFQVGNGQKNVMFDFYMGLSHVGLERCNGMPVKYLRDPQPIKQEKKGFGAPVGIEVCGFMGGLL